MTTPEPLVDLDDVKAHLNLGATDTSGDAELLGFIEAASAYIQNITGPIVARTFTEVHSGGGPTIVLNHPPVSSIVSVVEYVGPTGYTLTDSELGATTGAYAFSLDNPSTGVLTRRYNGGIAGRFMGGYRNIVVTYVAGLPYVPADIRMAVLQDIAGLYQPSQLGTANPYNAELGNGPLNPIGMFPRVAEVLSAPVKRTPSIA